MKTLIECGGISSYMYGSDARIFITLDNDGKFNIADYYIHGYGTKNDHN